MAPTRVSKRPTPIAAPRPKGFQICTPSKRKTPRVYSKGTTTQVRIERLREQVQELEKSQASTLIEAAAALAEAAAATIAASAVAQAAAETVTAIEHKAALAEAASQAQIKLLEEKLQYAKTRPCDKCWRRRILDEP